MASGKRGQNEGSITKLADGRWQARLTIVGEDGRTKRKAFYGKTKKEAHSKMLAAQRDLQQGLPIAGERQTVGQFLTRWLDDVARHTLRATTFDSYRRRLRRDVLPALAKVPLAKLSPQDLAHLYSALLNRGLSRRTVEYDHTIIRRALEQAVRWNLIGRNPADAVDPPRPIRQERKPLTRRQIERLLRAAEDERYPALFVVAVLTGMRAGELLGLRWSDVDLEAGALQVRQQVGRLAGGGGFIYSEPKTAKGRRTITLTPRTVVALRAHREAQADERRRAGEAWRDLDLVFTNRYGGPIERSNLQRRYFKPLLAKAGLPEIRFHDLRHAHATLMLRLEVHPKVVQERLGHSTIGTTMDIYSHVMPSMQRDAAERLEGLLDGSEEE